MAGLCVINTVNMPVQFSYTLPVRQRRQSILQTIAGVKWVYDPNEYDGDSQFSWECQSCNPCEVNHVLGAMTFGDSYTFTGYWTDSYTVILTALDNPEPAGGRLYDLSGMFTILVAASWPDDMGTTACSINTTPPNDQPCFTE